MGRTAAVLLSVFLATGGARAEGPPEAGQSPATWVAVLRGRDEPARARAAAALARVGPPAAEAVPALVIALLGSPKNEDLRVNAALALGKILGEGPRITGVPGAIPSGEPPAGERSGVAREKAVPALVKALADRCADVRTNASLSLGRIGPPAESAALPLLAAMADSERAVRRNAVIALETVPFPPAKGIPVLARALADEDATVANAAARALATLEGAAVPALKDLRAALRRDLEKPRGLIQGFGGGGGPGPPGVSSLAASPTLSSGLCFAIGAMGKEGAPGLPEVLVALRAKNTSTRSAALQAIDAIRARPEESVPALAEALEDAEEAIRGHACLVLAGFGPDARPALPALERLRDGATGGVRQNALHAIDRIAGKAVATGAGEAAPELPAGLSRFGGSGGGMTEVWR